MAAKFEDKAVVIKVETVTQIEKNLIILLLNALFRRFGRWLLIRGQYEHSRCNINDSALHQCSLCRDPDAFCRARRPFCRRMGAETTTAHVNCKLRIRGKARAGVVWEKGALPLQVAYKV